jgi:hypothetical protein
MNENSTEKMKKNQKNKLNLSIFGRVKFIDFWQKYRQDIYCLLIFAILVMVVFYDPLFTGKVYYIDDIEGYGQPMRKFQFDMGQNHKIYLWNPYQFAGTPFFQDPQTGLTYPFNWIFFFIPPERAVVWFFVLHVFIAGIFTFIMLRGMKLNRIPSFAGAVFYAFSGILLVKTVHMTIFACTCILPLVLHLTNKLIEKPNILYSICLGLGFALHLSIGYYSNTQIVYLLAFVLILANLGWKRKDLKYGIQWSLLGFFCLAALFSVGLSSLQFIPTYDLVEQCTRYKGFSSYQEATAGSLGLSDLTTLFVPDYYGNPLHPPGYIGRHNFWDQNCYIGIFPFILAVFGAFMLPKTERKIGIGFGIITVFAFLYCMGDNTFFYKLFYDFVPFGKIHHMPIRYLVFLLPGISYFVSWGVQKLMYPAEEEKKRLMKVFMGVLAFFLMISLFYLVKPPKITDGLMLFQNTWIPCPEKTVSPFVYTGLFFFFLTGICSLIMIGLRIRNLMKLNWFAGSVVAVLIVSALSFSYTWNPSVDISHYTNRAESLKSMEYKNPPVRAYYVPKILQNTWGLLNTRGISNLTGYNPLILTHYANYMLYAEMKRFPISADIEKLLNCSNRYPFAGRDLTNKMLLLLNPQGIYITTLEQDGKVRMYFQQIDNPYPRAFIVNDYRFIRDEEEVLATLNSAEFDPLKTVILSGDPEKENVNGDREDLQGSRDEVEFLTYEPDRLTLRVNPKGKSVLFMSEIYARSWKAKVDGKERKVYKANGIYRAIQLEPGDKMAEFYYSPDSIKTGALVSLITFLLMLGLGIFCFKVHNNLI